MPIPKTALPSNLPFPTASLLIDTRDTGNNNYILDTLQEEIAALYQDLQLADENQWSYLTQVIGYLKLGTLSPNELNLYYEPNILPLPQPEKDLPIIPPNSTNPQQPQRVVTQLIVPPNSINNPHQTQRKPTRPPLGIIPVQGQNRDIHTQTNRQSYTINDIPGGRFRDRLHEIITCCNDLRTKRIEATRDIGKDGLLRENRPYDTTVRIVLLADALDRDSLATAATYAGFLRDLAPTNIQPDIYNDMPMHLTTIICMNYTNRGENTRLLLDTLSWRANPTWPHIDSCILVERESQQGAPLPMESQEEYVEFLLYILFLTDPQEISIHAEAPDLEPLYNPNKKTSMLPHHKCFTFALAAFTYSRRRGMALLNNGLASSIVSELTDSSAPQVDSSTEFAIEEWFNKQLTTIQSTIPQQFLRQMPELATLEPTKQLTQPKEDLFPIGHSFWTTLDIGRDSLITLDHYAEDLGNTYTTSTPSLKNAIAREATVQGLVASNNWIKDAGSPLMQVFNNVCRVLIDEPFFTDTKGAALRAKYQLSMLAARSAELHRQHHITPADQQREAFANIYANERQKLVLQNEKFPLLGQNFKKTLQWLSFSLWTLIIVVVYLLGLTLILNAISTDTQSSTMLDQFVIPGVTWSVFGSLAFLVIIVLVFCVPQLPFNKHSLFFNPRRSPLRVEIICATMLIIYTLLGILMSFFLPSLALTSISIVITSWLFILSVFSLVSGAGAIILFIVETIGFFPWRREIKKMRNNTVEELRKTHLAYRDQIKQYIAEAFLLALLRQASIVDNTYENTGPYNHALEQLCDRLEVLKGDISTQYNNTRRQLERTASDPQAANNNRVNLRKELLQVPQINNYLEAAKVTFHTKTTFIHFVQILLRIFGSEQPGQILRDMEKSQPTAALSLNSRSQTGASLLLSTLTAQMFMLSLRENPLAPPDIEFTERAKRLPSEYSEIQKLITSRQTQREQTIRLQHMQSGHTPDTSLAQRVLTLWTQTFWHDDEQVSKLLPKEHVASHPEYLSYKTRAVRDILNSRLDFVGRPLNVGQLDTTYLLMHPDIRSTQLVENLDMSCHITDFLDSEVLALLSLIHYVSAPYEEEINLPGPQDDSDLPDDKDREDKHAWNDTTR